MHAAAEKGHLEVVHALLDAKATMTCQDKDGRTPLHKACERGSLQVAAALLEAGADTAVTDAVRFGNFLLAPRGGSTYSQLGIFSFWPGGPHAHALRL